MGMLPLALGVGESGETWAPMARAVMGGLIVATVLTLNVLPIIYSYVEQLSAWIRKKRKQREANRLAKGKIVEQF
jgi:HAE1 family hydrophobic/amphiphilic exporter-1